MNLPFSPTFFRKMDIFQQLMEYESQKEKHLWGGEKALLMWARGEEHQHLGSALGINHAKNALDYCVRENFIPQSENDRMRGSARHILENLTTHEFGDLVDNSNPRNPGIKINRNGILAGQILIETNNLNNPKMYQAWIFIWWVVLGGAVLILLNQSAQALLGILGMFKCWYNQALN